MTSWASRRKRTRSSLVVGGLVERLHVDELTFDASRRDDSGGELLFEDGGGALDQIRRRFSRGPDPVEGQTDL